MCLIDYHIWEIEENDAKIGEYNLLFKSSISISEDERDQLRDVVGKIDGGKLVEITENDINNAQKVLWKLFCQARGISER